MEGSLCAGESTDCGHLYTYFVVSIAWPCGKREEVFSPHDRFGLGKVHQELKAASSSEPPRAALVDGEEMAEEPLPLELPDDFTKPEYRWALFRMI